MGLRSSAAQPLRQAVRGRPGVFEVAPISFEHVGAFCGGAGGWCRNISEFQGVGRCCRGAEPVVVGGLD